MNEKHSSDPTNDQACFSAILTPHRSLKTKGFIILMALIILVSFIAGLGFFLIGAWPVVGFFGLDVLLVYLAFKMNYRNGRLYETVNLTENELVVTRVSPAGKSQSWRFNPYWVRLAVDRNSRQQTKLRLSSHGKHLIFGSFLTDEEKQEFAEALDFALRQNRDSSHIVVS